VTGERRLPAAANPPTRSRPVSVRATIVLLTVSATIAILLGEALVRAAKPGFPGFRVPQVEHRPVRGLGFEMVPSQVAFSTASRVTVNAAGFRGAEIRSVADAGYPRVLCLGDSMTFGVGVEDDETYPQQLQRLLALGSAARSPEVINAGVQRYFTYQEIDLLRRQVGVLQPNVVTLAVYINDLALRPTDEEDYVREYENEREQAATSFRRRFPTTYLLLKNSASVELIKNTYLKVAASTRTQTNIAEEGLAGRIRERDEPRWQAVERELVTFKELSLTHQFRPIVVFVPVRRQIAEDLPASVYPARLADYARGLGIETIDPTDTFKQSLRAGSDPYLPWDDHMSVAGHRIVAEAIAREIGRHAFGTP
jgi:lysophospholipase L1-like esterase